MIGQIKPNIRKQNVILRWKIKNMIKVWKKRTKQSNHRLLILKQWYQTQQSYIQDLNTIKNDIEHPLLQKGLITTQQAKILFPSIESMIQLSSQLAGTLQTLIASWHPLNTMIGQTLIYFHKFFMIYRQYCNNFMKSQLIIKQIRKNTLSNEIENKLKMDYQSYIIKPVQRPPKYQLLLRQYLKVLPQQHSDYIRLQQAISKYHQVNQTNNQSMDRQIRDERMIKLDKKYSGIISNRITRFYINQFEANSIDFKCKLYLFNDLLLVTKINQFNSNNNKQQAYIKIYLNGNSFIQLSMDGKYFKNKLFICGINNSIHLNFNQLCNQIFIYNLIKDIIYQLYRKQQNRKSIINEIQKKKKLYTRLRVTQYQYIKQNYLNQSITKFRIMVVGVQKRPSSKIYYIIRFQTLLPYQLNQIIYIQFDDLLEIQKMYKNLYKGLYIPILDIKPNSMNYYDIKKNKTQIFQYRSIFIQKFLNFIFRSEELNKNIKLAIHKLKIINELCIYSTQNNQQCNCNLCLQLQSLQSLKYYQNIIETIKNTIYQSKYCQKKEKEKLNNFNQKKKYCINHIFNLQHYISKVPIIQFDTIERKLLYVETKLGRINTELLLLNENTKQNISLKIYLFSILQDEYINIEINELTSANQLLNNISNIYNLKTIRDFGLFIQYQQILRWIDHDENIYDLFKENQIQTIDNDMNKNNYDKNDKNGFFKKVQNWGKQFIGVKKCKIYMKKCIFLEKQLEINLCYRNPERYKFIVQQLFYYFKIEQLILPLKDTIFLCALYYSLRYLDTLGYFKSTNFQKLKLKYFLPQSQWKLLEQQKFLKQVIHIIQNYKNLIKNTNLINLIYNDIITLVSNVWGILYFNVENYEPQSLWGGNINLLLGINKDYLIIIRPRMIQPLLKIKINQLQYNVTAFSIFIKYQNKQYRFDSLMTYDIRKILEIYSCLNGIQKIQ